MIKNDEDYLIRRTYTNYGGVNMAFDLSDEELQATREMNKTAWESEIDKWSKEYLIERYKDLVEIEKEHKKENGKLREEIKELMLDKKAFTDNYGNMILKIAELEKENKEIRQWKYVIDTYADLEKLKELDLIKIEGKEYISKDKIERIIDKIYNKYEDISEVKNDLEELLEEGDDK